MTRIAHTTGDPLQVWKWPALLLMGLWSYLTTGSIGHAAGATVGAAIMFVLATMVARRAGIAQRLPWWLQATVASLAGALSFLGLATAGGTPFSGFVSIYLVLLLFAWIAFAGAGLVGLREPSATAE